MNGNTINAPISAPIDACSISLAILGLANSGCAGGATTDTAIVGSGGGGGNNGDVTGIGNLSAVNGNTINAPVSAPISLCGVSGAIASAATWHYAGGSRSSTAIVGSGGGGGNDGDTSGVGNISAVNGNTINAPISAPIDACSISLAILGLANSGCAAAPPPTPPSSVRAAAAATMATSPASATCPPWTATPSTRRSASRSASAASRWPCSGRPTPAVAARCRHHDHHHHPAAHLPRRGLHPAQGLPRPGLHPAAGVPRPRLHHPRLPRHPLHHPGVPPHALHHAPRLRRPHLHGGPARPAARTTGTRAASFPASRLPAAPVRASATMPAARAART